MPVELRSATPPLPEKRGLTGRHVLFAMIAFFAVIGAVNAVMIYLAIHTMPGTTVKSAYESSQTFNRGLEAIAAQDRLGWQVDVATTGLHSNAPLNVHIRDRNGEAISGLEVQVRVERPTDARLDRKLKLVETGGGRYATALPELAAGQWILIVEIYRSDSRQFVSERRIVLRD
ncbi:MAG TPA: FixH family protein [Rhabdaerophilum sp.]|nr:FixH family protein [Rhabdaerophilum sp.]